MVTHSAAAPKEPPIIRLKYMLPGTMMKADEEHAEDGLDRKAVLEAVRDLH